MTTNDIYSRVWFETIDAAAETGMSKAEAEEQAVATLMIEVNAGRLTLDLEGAVLAKVRKADESHGRVADSLLAKIAAGDALLFAEDLDYVVTLGGGLRKAWYHVDAADLDAMNEIRYKNYRSVRESFQEFNGHVIAVRPIILEHGTMGAAYEAGAFVAQEKAA